MRIVSRASAMIVVALLVPFAARADGEVSSRAEASFREGRAAMEAGDYPLACAKFAESQSLEPAAGTLLNLADCYERDGKMAKAWRTFRQAANASAERGRTDWEREATAKTAALARQLSMLTIAVAEPTQPELVVRLDGEPVERGEWGAAVAVDPGEHAIEASAAARVGWSSRVVLTKGASVTVVVPRLELVAAPPVVRAEPPPPPPADHREPGPWRSVGFVTAGTGLAFAIAGSVMGALAKTNLDDAKGLCPSYPDRCDAAGEGAAANDRARTFAQLSNVGFVTGAVLLVAGVVLVVLPPKPRAVVRSLVPFAGTF